MKTTKDMIAVMQAYADGEEIEYTNKNSPMDWLKTKNPLWDWCASDYRVKQAPEYVPFTFEDAEFLIGKAIKSKDKPVVLLIQVVYDKNVVLHKFDTISYYLLLKNYTFLDGSPCGKLKQ